MDSGLAPTYGAPRNDSEESGGRSQISRLLDPKDGSVTITTLQRAAKIVGRTFRLELVWLCDGAGIQR